MFQIVPIYENSSTGEQFKPTVGWGEDLKPLRFKNRLEKIYDLVKRSQKKRGLSLERMTLLMSQQLKTLDKELNKAIFVPVLEYQKSLRQFEPYCHHLMGLFVTFQRPAKESMVFQFRSGDGTSPVEAESAKSMLKRLPNRNPEVENFLAAYLLNTDPKYRYGPVWLMRSVQACWVYLLSNRNWDVIRKGMKSLVDLRSQLAPNHKIDYQFQVMTELILIQLLEYDYCRSLISKNEANPDSKAYRSAVIEKNRALKVYSTSFQIHAQTKTWLNLVKPQAVFKTPDQFDSQKECLKNSGQTQVTCLNAITPNRHLLEGKFCTTTGFRPSSWIAYQVLDSSSMKTTGDSGRLAMADESFQGMGFRVRACPSKAPETGC